MFSCLFLKKNAQESVRAVSPNTYPELTSALNQINDEIQAEWMEETNTSLTIGFCERGVLAKLPDFTQNAYKDVAKNLKKLSIGKVSYDRAGHFESLIITIKRNDIENAISKLHAAYPLKHIETMSC
jgi:hypothetical protein